MKVRPILIHWEDSCGDSGAWGDAYDLPTDLSCYTAGWVIKETDTQILVAQSVAPSFNRKYMHQLVIPKGAILHRAWAGKKRKFSE